MALPTMSQPASPARRAMRPGVDGRRVVRQSLEPIMVTAIEGHKLSAHGPLTSTLADAYALV